MAECKQPCKCEEYKKKIAALEQYITNLVKENMETKRYYTQVIKDFAWFTKNLSKNLYEFNDIERDEYNFNDILEKSKLTST